MRPYYDEDGITIYHGDCREACQFIAAEHFDLLVTDPPYGLGDQWRKSGTPHSRWRTGIDEMGWDQVVIDVAWLLPLVDDAVIWGGHLLSLPPSRGWLVWNKIIRNFSSGVCELAWTTLDAPVDAFDYSHGQLANEGKFHPTQKPLELMRWCIRKFPSSKRLIDPFAGSGTTLVAAKIEQRQAIGIEINEQYCEIAANRLRQRVLEF